MGGILADFRMATDMAILKVISRQEASICSLVGITLAPCKCMERTVRGPILLIDCIQRAADFCTARPNQKKIPSLMIVFIFVNEKTSHIAEGKAFNVCKLI